MLDFFEQQQRAKRRTALLVVLYLIGVAVVTVCTVPPVMFLAWGFMSRGRDHSYRPGEPVGIDPLLNSHEGRVLLGISCLVALGIIFGTSAFKYLELRAGGDGVARRLGGRRIPTNTTDPDERRLLNVIEEMAIASGVPVPPAYVMDEERGINAFAAGFSPSDAVIGVTRGCLLSLTRDQLQGVIAHEFSHILNGDMRLSLRVIALLHGILAVQMMGYILCRVRGRRAGGIILAGLAMIVIGFVGGLVAKIIKAMISRQREFLADASAVQFTRDPSGLSGALRVIGGGHSRVLAPNAEECSHMYFAEGLSGWLDSMFATHPPLKDRIRRLEPAWDGTWLKARPMPVYAEPPPARKTGIPLVPFATATAAAAVEDLAAVASMRRAEVGLAAEEVVRRIVAARQTLDALPQSLLNAARDPWEAQALVLGMLLDSNPQVRQVQASSIRPLVGDALAARIEQLGPEVRRAGKPVRLPLIEIALGAMASMSREQHRAFRDAANALIHADQRISLFEWCLERLLVVHLDRRFVDPRPVPTQYYRLTRLSSECSLLLSAIALAGSADAAAAKQAFDRAARMLGVPGLALGERTMRLEALEAALDTFATVTAPLKRRLVMACAAAIGADADIRPDESELLRAVADTLGVPLAADPVPLSSTDSAVEGGA